MILDIFSELQKAVGMEEPRLYAEALEQAKLADELGYGCWWSVEHHCTADFSYCSTPDMFLTMVSQHTERIRLGTAGTLAPFGIHVALIVPGFVDTETFDNSRAASVHLREDAANPYLKMMIDLDEFAATQTKNALPPEVIGRVVVRAATERRPRMRYYAPFSGRLQDGFLGLLPESWVHRLLLRIYKIEAR